MSTSETEAVLTVIYLGLIPVAFLIYAIPSIIAFRRHHSNRFAILAVNIVFGGTGIGWFGALVWALGAFHLSNAAGGSNGGESGLNLFAHDVKPVRLVGPSMSPVVDPGPEAPPTISGAVAEIERLSALREAGHLSETEFADLKGAVLRRTRIGASA